MTEDWGSQLSPKEACSPHRSRGAWRCLLRSRWFVAIFVSLGVGTLAWLASVALGAATTCAAGQSPLTFALLAAVTAGLGALWGRPSR